VCVSWGSLAWRRRRSGCEFQGEGTGREKNRGGGGGQGGDGGLLGGGRFCVGFGGDGGDDLKQERRERKGVAIP
jgi:hypothetical protein